MRAGGTGDPVRRLFSWTAGCGRAGMGTASHEARFRFHLWQRRHGPAHGDEDGASHSSSPAKKRGESIMAKPIITLLAALAFAGFGAMDVVQAEDLEFRAVMHVVSSQNQDVGDVEGHILGVVRATGIASFQDGSTAATHLVAQIDYVKGSGTDMSYDNLTFDDGSVLWYKTSGMATVDGTRTIFKGTITVVGGSGRFAGAKGEGGYSGARLTRTSADLFLDEMISVKK
jgi:hypothetical protein